MEKMLILVDMCIVVSVVRLVVCVVGSPGLSDPSVDMFIVMSVCG